MITDIVFDSSQSDYILEIPDGTAGGSLQVLSYDQPTSIFFEFGSASV